MKIGILTYHRSHNYGALLQAIALRYTLTCLGHKVYFIDYYPDYHKKMYEIHRISLLYTIKHPKLGLEKWLDIIWRYRRRVRFNSFQKKHITPFCKSTAEEFDAIVYGSDQIWRKQPYIDKYNPIYFGAGCLNAKIHISYAASSDRPPETESEKKVFAEYLQHLNSISVRESWLLDSIRNLGYDGETSLDPTLLLSSKEWDNLIPIKKDKGDRYLLYYNLIPGSFDEDEIKRFAAEKGLKIKTIVGTAYYNRNKYVDTIGGPNTFLDAIRNAEYVFTSSFHGLVFSILYHKSFFASFAYNAKRAEALLNSVSLHDRLLVPQSHIPSIKTNIDFIKVEKELDAIRKNSINYLMRNLHI